MRESGDPKQQLQSSGALVTDHDFQKPPRRENDYSDV